MDDLDRRRKEEALARVEREIEKKRADAERIRSDLHADDLARAEGLGPFRVAPPATMRTPPFTLGKTILGFNAAGLVLVIPVTLIVFGMAKFRIGSGAFTGSLATFFVFGAVMSLCALVTWALERSWASRVRPAPSLLRSMLRYQMLPWLLSNVLAVPISLFVACFSLVPSTPCRPRDGMLAYAISQGLYLVVLGLPLTIMAVRSRRHWLRLEATSDGQNSTPAVSPSRTTS